eukprot:935798-Pyramimonas_sp.AAC.1
MSSQLTDQEVEHFRKKFNQFDRDNCGRLDLWELRGLLSSVGQDPTEDELSLLISAVDDQGNGSIEGQQGTWGQGYRYAESGSEVLRLVEVRTFLSCKYLRPSITRRRNPEAFTEAAVGLYCTVAAFVAMGGNEDKSGELNTEKLKTVVKDYRLSINIDGLLLDIDSDSSGYIDYEEFMTLLGD